MLERLKIIEKIGQGGMAEVYLAHLFGAYDFKKEVVVKKILSQQFNQDKLLKMFVDEANVSAHLNHSNIVQIYDFFEEDENLHILMEYINGTTLRDLIIENYKIGEYIPIEHVLYIINELLNGMDFYHNKRDLNGKKLNIIHRDLTPKNILISIYGDVKISDFGIARFEDKREVTTFGEVKGKPSYLSPEQIKLLPDIDHRVDLFSLGVIFYELLTNLHPFKVNNQYETQKNIITGIYKPIQKYNRKVPKGITAIVSKLLETDRDKRYRSAKEVKKDILSLKHPIANRLSFSQYFSSTVIPDALNYVESIANEVNKDKNDYREIKNKPFYLQLIPVLIAILIIINGTLFVLLKDDSSSYFSNIVLNRFKQVPKPFYTDYIEIDIPEIYLHNKDDDLNLDKNGENNGDEKIDKKDSSNDKDIVDQKNKTKKVEKRKNRNKKRKVIKGWGKVDIHVIPYGKIYIDGKLISEISINNYKIKAGFHTLKVENSDFSYKKVRKINIKPNKTKTFYFKINK